MPYTFKGDWAIKKDDGKRIPKRQAIAIMIAEKKKEKNGK